MQESTATVAARMCTAVDPTARISPRASLGIGCRIGPGAVVDGDSVVGDYCTIGADAYLKDSVLAEGVRVGIQANLVDCIVAARVDIGRGARLTNGLVPQPDLRVPAGAIVDGPVRILNRMES